MEDPLYILVGTGATILVETGATIWWRPELHVGGGPLYNLVETGVTVVILVSSITSLNKL